MKPFKKFLISKQFYWKLNTTSERIALNTTEYGQFAKIIPHSQNMSEGY